MNKLVLSLTVAIHITVPSGGLSKPCNLIFYITISKQSQVTSQPRQEPALLHLQALLKGSTPPQ